jgi:transglutaminase-like putative cysteine protease
MRFKVQSELAYEVKSPSTLIFAIQALSASSQEVVEESLVIEPRVKHDEFVSASGDSRFIRVVTGPVERLELRYGATVDTQHTVIDSTELGRVPVQQLDHYLITLLFPSRYCQSDQLSRLAWQKFGNIDNAYERVVAITDWIHRNVEYISGSTNSQTSAYDTVTQRAGVCRDFAHLGVALCRALNIPARYFAGYAYQLDPPDFHACFEAFVGGRWVVFDATRLVPLNGLVRIGTGRDAADAAVVSIFGQVKSTGMKVSCEVVGKGFVPLTADKLTHKGLCLEPAAP